MYGSGVRIGMARIHPLHRAILQGLQPAPTALIVAALGTTFRGFVVLPFATAVSLALGTDFLASA